MKDWQEFQDCADRLKALADPDRLQIVVRLFQGETTVSGLAEDLQEAVVNVSHHLRVLHRAGVVEAEKRGRFVVYRLRQSIVLSKGTGGRRRIDFGCCSLDLNGKSTL